jgi:hypothetical protein
MFILFCAELRPFYVEATRRADAQNISNEIMRRSTDKSSLLGSSMLVRYCGAERGIIETALVITLPTRVGHIEDLKDGSLQTASVRHTNGT